MATTTLIKDRNSGRFQKAEWSIKFSDRDWVVEVADNGGEDQVKYTISGFLWGGDNEDWLIGFSGTGRNGKEPVHVNGKAMLRYDSRISDHAAMDFHNVVKFGENSIWGWLVGAELIVGGAIGAGGAVIAVTISTAGVGLPAAVLIGAAGAIGGASALVSISETVRNLVNSDQPVPAPTPPNPPAVPDKEENVSPTKDKLTVAISREGRVVGNGPDGVLALSGSVRGNAGTAVLFPR